RDDSGNLTSIRATFRPSQQMGGFGETALPGGPGGLRPASRSTNALAFGSAPRFSGFRQSERSPQVPARDGAPGTPALRVALDGGGFRGTALAVEQAEGLPDRKVAGGQDIGPAQVEDHQDVDGPRADAAHGRQARDQFVVRQAFDFTDGGNGSPERLRGQV